MIFPRALILAKKSLNRIRSYKIRSARSSETLLVKKQALKE